ncbi:MAG: hypothetical protein QOH79_519 [Acidimicrobiaceae bacterium]
MPDKPWQREAEILLGEVARLLDERDQLARRLRDLELDFEVALAYIEELRCLNEALSIELYRLKGHGPKKERVGRLAAGIAGVLIGLGGGFAQGAGQEAYQEWRGIHDQAVVVSVQCEMPQELIPPWPATEYEAMIHADLGPLTATIGQATERDVARPLSVSGVGTVYGGSTAVETDEAHGVRGEVREVEDGIGLTDNLMVELENTETGDRQVFGSDEGQGTDSAHVVRQPET